MSTIVMADYRLAVVKNVEGEDGSYYNSFKLAAGAQEGGQVGDWYSGTESEEAIKVKLYNAVDKLILPYLLNK